MTGDLDTIGTGSDLDTVNTLCVLVRENLNLHTTWVDIFLRVGTRHRHVQVDSLPDIFLHVVHPHEGVHPDAPQEADAGLIPIEAKQEPHRALVLTARQNVEDVWYSSCRAGKTYKEILVC